MSAPPTSVTGAQPPKVSQVPFGERRVGALDDAAVASTPDRESVPSASVSGTDAVAYHGPVARSTVWPVGAMVSGVTVKSAVPVVPAPFVAVTVFTPVALSADVQW